MQGITDPPYCWRFWISCWVCSFLPQIKKSDNLDFQYFQQFFTATEQCVLTKLYRFCRLMLLLVLFFLLYLFSGLVRSVKGSGAWGVNNALQPSHQTLNEPVFWGACRLLGSAPDLNKLGWPFLWMGTKLSWFKPSKSQNQLWFWILYFIRFSNLMLGIIAHVICGFNE